MPATGRGPSGGAASLPACMLCARRRRACAPCQPQGNRPQPHPPNRACSRRRRSAASDAEFDSYNQFDSTLPPAADEEGRLRVTLEFVQGMLEAFKNEQLVHRRYAFEIILQASGASRGARRGAAQAKQAAQEAGAKRCMCVCSVLLTTQGNARLPLPLLAPECNRRKPSSRRCQPWWTSQSRMAASSPCAATRTASERGAGWGAAHAVLRWQWCPPAPPAQPAAWGGAALGLPVISPPPCSPPPLPQVLRPAAHLRPKRAAQRHQPIPLQRCAAVLTGRSHGGAAVGADTHAHACSGRARWGSSTSSTLARFLRPPAHPARLQATLLTAAAGAWRSS